MRHPYSYRLRPTRALRMLQIAAGQREIASTASGVWVRWLSITKTCHVSWGTTKKILGSYLIDMPVGLKR